MASSFYSKRKMFKYGWGDHFCVVFCIFYWDIFQNKMNGKPPFKMGNFRSCNICKKKIFAGGGNSFFYKIIFS